MSKPRKTPDPRQLELPGAKILPRLAPGEAPLGARKKDRFSKGPQGDCSKLLPRWREVACAGCGESLNVRDDVKEPVLCDPCDYAGVTL